MFEYKLTMVWRNGAAKTFTEKSEELIRQIWRRQWTEFITYGQLSKINTAANNLIVEVECTAGATKRENF